MLLLPWGIKKKIAWRINFMIYYEVNDGDGGILKLKEDFQGLSYLP